MHFTVAYIAGLVLLVIGLLFLATWILQWLWNMTMPEVFNLKKITFWQAFRLIFNSRDTIWGDAFQLIFFMLPCGLPGTPDSPNCCFPYKERKLK